MLPDVAAAEADAADSVIVAPNNATAAFLYTTDRNTYAPSMDFSFIETFVFAGPILF
jgi:hypothetical protein